MLPLSPELQITVKNFNEKINAIRGQFFSALDDFKKYYVYYNKNPEVNEFQNYYTNSKGQLQTLSKDLFVTTNDIDKEIESLEEKIKTMTALLKEEKGLNAKLMELINDIDNTHVGSDVLISDSKKIYNKKYYMNMRLIIGVIIVGILLVVLFKGKSDSISGAISSGKSSGKSSAISGTNVGSKMGVGYFIIIAFVLLLAGSAYLSFGMAAIFVFGATIFFTLAIFIYLR
jgi:hypothetical protein